MLLSSRKLFSANIPSLVVKNQTVEEFWKWVETHFDDPIPVAKDLIMKLINDIFTHPFAGRISPEFPP
jgi:hypothetical protein